MCVCVCTNLSYILHYWIKDTRDTYYRLSPVGAWIYMKLHGANHYIKVKLGNQVHICKKIVVKIVPHLYVAVMKKQL